jgi:hypothetical protein
MCAANPLKSPIANPLGKGEVHSSILCGSTKNPFEIGIFSTSQAVGNASSRRNEARNAQLDSWKIRGLCSAAVPAIRAVAGPAILLISAILSIMSARTARHYATPGLFMCHPGDRNTINGRELCPHVAGQNTESVDFKSRKD